MTGTLNVLVGALEVGDFDPQADTAKIQINSANIDLLNGAGIMFSGIGFAQSQDAFRTAIRAIGGPAGVVDNAVPRANGTGGYTVQGSDIGIDDAATATQANVAITNQHTGQTNSSLVLTPKGTGAFILGPKPDGTAVGGNARGANAVDLQTSRSASAQVASGLFQPAVLGGTANTASANYAVVAGGQTGTASGINSFVAGGQSNLASGASSFVTGSSNIASGTGAFSFGVIASADRRGMLAQAAGQFANQGDAQRARFVLRCKTTTNTAVEMALDGGTTYLTIPSGKIIFANIKVVGTKSDGSAVATYERQYAVKNVAATSTQIYAPVTIGSDNASGTVLDITTQDAGDYISIKVTGIASETWRWVASVDAVEVAYGT
jgi:hypothetical protein